MKNPSPHFRIVEMFHAGSPKSVKEHVLTEMCKVNSCLRILICTIAFGTDCKDVYRIIHFGPSKTLESYLQECGRDGRDNSPSICCLLYNGFLVIAQIKLKSLLTVNIVDELSSRKIFQHVMMRPSKIVPAVMCVSLSVSANRLAIKKLSLSTKFLLTMLQ